MESPTLQHFEEGFCLKEGWTLFATLSNLNFQLPDNLVTPRKLEIIKGSLLISLDHCYFHGFDTHVYNFHATKYGAPLYFYHLDKLNYKDILDDIFYYIT